MENHIRKVEEEAIKYAFSHGGEKSVTIFRNVNNMGNDAGSYGTVCQSFYLDSSNNTIVFDKKVCDELPELYACNQFKEIAFFLLGYMDSKGKVFIKELNYQNFKSNNIANVVVKSKEVIANALKSYRKYGSMGQSVLFVGHNHTLTDSKHKEARKLINNLSLTDLLSYKIDKNIIEKGILSKLFCKDIFFGCFMINPIGDITVVKENNFGRLEKFDRIKFLDRDNKIKNISQYSIGEEYPLGNYREIDNNYTVTQDKEAYNIIDSIINKDNIINLQ